MAIISRLGGAILAKTEDLYYLVGDLKEPIDFAKHGFTRPAEREVKEIPFVVLEVSGPVQEPKAVLMMDLEGLPLAKKLASSFMIRRNGSISERLWTLVEESSADAKDGTRIKDANWLAATPDDIWDIVRDSVLRCS